MKKSIQTKFKEAIIRNWILILILIVGLIIRTQNITAPCGVGHLGYGCGYYGNIGENYLNYGFIKTKFGAVTNQEIVSPSNFIYNVHHPSQLFYLLIGLSFKIFGNNTWNLRLIPLLFSIGSFLLVYWITKEKWNKKVALFAVFFFAIVPMATIYGAHVDVQGSIPLFFILLTFFFYSRWEKNKKKRFYWLMVASLLIGTQTDWPVYFVIPFIFLHHIITAEKIKKEILLFPL